MQNWKQSLLDLTLRNRLLNMKPNAEVVELILPRESLAELDDQIHNGGFVSVLGKDAVSDLRQLQGVTSVLDLPHDQLLDDLVSGHRIHADITEKSYRTRLRSLVRSVRTLAEETGSSNLYLTLGSMEILGSTGNPAQAPLFLIPVKITGGTGNSRFSISVDTSTQATPNYCLVEWLRNKHDVVIPSLNEPPLDDSGLDITRALEEISRSLTAQSLPYEIRETAFVGICKFSTYGMWRDLEEQWVSLARSPVFRHLVEKSGSTFVDPAGAEDLRDLDIPEDQLALPIAADGAQMRAIVAAGQGRSFVLEGPPGTGKSQTITNLIAHSLLQGRTMLFVAEKQAALDVVKGRLEKIGLADFSLDLHGVDQKPTSIRNQLKASIDLKVAYDDRTWRTVVDRYRARLDPLREYPAKIHSSNAAGYSLWSAVTTLDECGPGRALPVDAKSVTSPEIDELLIEDALRDFERIARTTPPGAHPEWDLIGPGATSATDDDVLAAVSRFRSALDGLPPAVRDAVELESATVHTEAPTAFLTPLVDHLDELHAHGEVPARDLDAGPSREMANRFRELAAAIHLFGQRIAPVRTVVPDIALVSGDFDSAAQLAGAIDDKIFGKKKRRTAFDEAAARLVSDPAAVTPERFGTLAADVTRARHEMNALDEQLNAVLSGSRHFGRTCLDDSLPTDMLDEAAVVDAVADSIEAQARFAREHQLFRSMIADHGIGHSDLPAIREFDAAWATLCAVLDVTPDRLDRWRDGRPWLTRLIEILPRWAEQLSDNGGGIVRRSAGLIASLQPLNRAGLAAAATALLSGEIEPVETTVALRRGLALASIEERSTAFGLSGFDAVRRDGDVEEFGRASARLRQEAPDALAARLLDQRPFRADRLTGEVAELSRQLNSKRGGLSFRRLMERYGSTITAITPCFFVSPASLANFVPAEGPLFDMVIFDEASQVTVDQAVGALGRARSAVIVGDSQQMPPTKFGASASGSDDDYDLDTEDEVVPTDLESILTECVESGLPRLWLSWHYRSQDERLIAFSNRQYYEGTLSSLPSPGGEPDAGIDLHRVQGHFHRSIPREWKNGGAPEYRHGITPRLRTNPVEAEAIVDDIAARVNDPARGGQSIGVVTFNVQQRDLILDALERSADPLIRARLDDEKDPLFVKNLENVQGDERDVILFSTAFSAKAAGERLPLNFGPLSRTGGEKRLNVAITRARRKVVVFSSFDAADIDLARSRSKGLADLRGYLEAAVADTGDGGAAARIKNSIRDDLARRLKDSGFDVTIEYGLSEFTVDLAVRHPGERRWECAVLLDSERWAAMPTVSDREMTPGLLGNMMRWGSVVRVWLPEWQSQPDQVVDKVADAVRRGHRELQERDLVLAESRRQMEERLAEDRKRTAARLAAEAADIDTRSADRDSGIVDHLEWAESDDLAVGQYGDAAPRSESTVPARHRQSVPPVTPPTPLPDNGRLPRTAGDSPRDSDRIATPRSVPVREVRFTPVLDTVLGTKDDLAAPVSPKVRALIQERLREVVSAEAPMTPEELARRIGTCFDVRRVSQRMRDVLLADLPTEWLHTSHNELFVWPDGVSPATCDTYRLDTDRPLTDLPLVEISNVMTGARFDGTEPEEDRFRAVLAKFGMRRLTAGMTDRLRTAWSLATAE